MISAQKASAAAFRDLKETINDALGTRAAVHIVAKKDDQGSSLVACCRNFDAREKPLKQIETAMDIANRKHRTPIQGMATIGLLIRLRASSREAL